MSVVNKALCGILSVVAVLFVSVASAEDAKEVKETKEADVATTKSRAVLFKIHDVTPIKDTEGLITDCDFLITFYNRTPTALQSAKLALGWTDDVSERYLKDLDDSESLPVNEPRPFPSRNGEKNLGSLITAVDMPALGAYSQISVKGSLKTDKCFLLLNPLKFNVEACNLIESNQTSTRTGPRNLASRANVECAGLFQFVDFTNPEYYDEFKEISYSEQEALLGKEKETNLDEINAKYNAVVTSLEKASNILSNIQ